MDTVVTLNTLEQPTRSNGMVYPIHNQAATLLSVRLANTRLEDDEQFAAQICIAQSGLPIAILAKKHCIEHYRLALEQLAEECKNRVLTKQEAQLFFITRVTGGLENFAATILINHQNNLYAISLNMGTCSIVKDTGSQLHTSLSATLSWNLQVQCERITPEDRLVLLDTCSSQVPLTPGEDLQNTDTDATLVEVCAPTLVQQTNLQSMLPSPSNSFQQIHNSLKQTVSKTSLYDNQEEESYVGDAALSDTLCYDSDDDDYGNEDFQTALIGIIKDAWYLALQLINPFSFIHFTNLILSQNDSKPEPSPQPTQAEIDEEVLYLNTEKEPSCLSKFKQSFWNLSIKAASYLPNKIYGAKAGEKIFQTTYVR